MSNASLGADLTHNAWMAADAAVLLLVLLFVLAPVRRAGMHAEPNDAAIAYIRTLPLMAEAILFGRPILWLGNVVAAQWARNGRCTLQSELISPILLHQSLYIFFTTVPRNRQIQSR